MAYLPDPYGRVRKRPLLRPGFYEDHDYELGKYARGELKDVTRAVAVHKSKRLSKDKGMPAA
ncbi:MAG: hypothetical protein V3U45_03735 [bacterium]